MRCAIIFCEAGQLDGPILVKKNRKEKNGFCKHLDPYVKTVLFFHYGVWQALCSKAKKRCWEVQKNVKKRFFICTGIVIFLAAVMVCSCLFAPRPIVENPETVSLI